jgi:hypothetical protein
MFFYKTSNFYSLSYVSSIHESSVFKSNANDNFTKTTTAAVDDLFTLAITNS